MGKALVHTPRTHLIKASVLSALLIGYVHNINFDLNVDNENFATKLHEAVNGKEEQLKLTIIMVEFLTKKISLGDLTMLRHHIQEKSS